MVAETPEAARDGAEAVMFDIDPLPAIVDPEEALAPGATQIHDDAANLCVDWQNGDFEAVEKAFGKAAHVTRMRIPINRVVVAAMEPRGAVGEYDAASGRFTVHLGCQGVYGMRQTLATAVLKIEPEKLRVISKDIGGSFGMKSQQFGENLLVLHAARDLGRPVKWIDDRSGAFLSDFQGRDMIADAALALNAEGDFLAMRIDMIGNLGAYMTPFGPVMPSGNIMKNVASLYKTPAIGVTCRCVFTNTVTIAPYRGAGRPEGNYIMERLVDAAARETGHDSLELRRRNLIPTDAIPFKAASGMEYDSGDFPAVLAEAAAGADWDGYEARRAASEAQGMLRGRAVTSYLEVTAGPGKELGAIRFRPDGRVTILTGTLDQGQGHATAFAQVVAGRLGISFDMIDLVQGDSDELKIGGGTGGSKSAMASGNAFALASDAVIENGRQWAAHEMEAAVQDIEFTAGEFRVAGTDRAIAIQDLAARVAAADGVPDGLPDSLDAELVTDTPPSAFPNGCHICEVEIDPETGHCRIDRYLASQRFRQSYQPHAGGRADTWRYCPGHWPGLDGNGGLRRRRPAAERFLHGLRHAPRRYDAFLRYPPPSGAGHFQCLGGQRLRRGGNQRGNPHRVQRDPRRAGAVGCDRPADAGHAGTHLARRLGSADVGRAGPQLQGKVAPLAKNVMTAFISMTLCK